MSKLIDADKLKASVAEKYVGQRRTKKRLVRRSVERNGNNRFTAGSHDNLLQMPRKRCV